LIDQVLFRSYPGAFREKIPQVLLKAVALAVAAALGFLLAGVLVITDGNVIPAAGFVAVVALALITLYRIEWGFYALVLAVFIFSQLEVPGFQSLTYQVSYFRNIKEIPYLPPIQAGVVTPFELHLAFVVFIWLAMLAMGRKVHLQPISLWLPAALWLVWMIVAFARGMQSGGEFLPALWETRAMAYLLFAYFFVPQMVHTREDVKALIWVIIAGISVKAFEGIVRYREAGWTTGAHETLTSHEDPVFFTTLFFLLLGLLVFGASRRQRIVLAVLFPFLLWGFFVGQRRAAYGGLIISIIVFLMLIPTVNLRRAVFVLVPVLLFLMGYVTLFWESESRLATPLQRVKSAVEGKDEQSEVVVKDRDYYSNLYRKIEDYDLAYTITSYPLFGTGFGMRYLQPIELLRLTVFPLQDFQAHNNVLWLFAKVGAVGFFFFWLFVNVTGFRGAMLVTKLKDPYLKAVAAMIVVALINQLIAAYFDLHLVWYRVMFYLGLLMGLVQSLENIQKKEITSEAVPPQS